MTSCDRFGELLYGYVEHRIEPAARAEVEAHRDACAPCAEIFRMAHETSCRELAGFLDDYVEGRLSQERRAVFERHLSICVDCVRYADGYRRALHLAADAGGDDAAIPPELVAAILAARRDRRD